jgi:hypothetical protein
MDEAKAAAGVRTASRRAVLAAAAGGIGAWVAAAFGRAAPAFAADGEVVNVGDNLTGSKTTSFTVSTPGFSALWGNATGGDASVGVRGDTVSSHYLSAGVLGIAPNSTGVQGSGFHGVEGEGTDAGVYGHSTSGLGLWGTSETNAGIKGTSNAWAGVLGHSANHAGVVGRQSNGGTGVMGYSWNDDLAQPSPVAKTGVYGESKLDAGSRGVWGASASGQGVRGDATTGVGVNGSASSASGYAFRGSGRVRFDKVSGVATIAAGATSVTVTPGVDVTADSFVLLTAKANIGSRSLYFSTDAANNKFTIRLSSTRSSSTVVAWLLLR